MRGDFCDFSKRTWNKRYDKISTNYDCRNFDSWRNIKSYFVINNKVAYVIFEERENFFEIELSLRLNHIIIKKLIKGVK